MNPNDYSILDHPQLLECLFHPRAETGYSRASSTHSDLLIPVEEDVVVGARFHSAQPSAPNILFFHGNGEIVADYDDFGPSYNGMGINFLPVDYRGYGRSTGRPSVSSMMKDCHKIFKFVTRWLSQQGYSGPMIVMGRSLGSACALELSVNYKEKISALVIESGFAFTIPLLKLLGVDTKAIHVTEEHGFRNIDKIKSFDKPTLVIHAALDHIIPFSDGQALYDACPSADKTLLKIPDANHNDIFLRGLSEYLDAVRRLAEKVK
ncbi:MAG: alpha/beta hydrolase [Deltaproteobacteria bacterium]|nr:alpha/beta hydrolase [Deltaproteobacteria bacterium]MBW1961864.1 alpha/beta hydrolase [Deltaproteobacteria bacterium]MBW2153354.1 alpha/beta hydrolase [Deltaproteobacteria bacterium]